MEILTQAIYFFAVFGFILLMSLAALGGVLIFQCLRFAVRLAYAEHKWKRLKKASAEALAEITHQDLKGEEEEIPPVRPTKKR